MTLAFLFDSVGFGEWVVLLAVILIVVGPKRLPATARKFGQYYAKFRRAAESFKRQLLDMDSEIGQAVKDIDKTVADVQQSIEHADAQWDAIAAGYPPESVSTPAAPEATPETTATAEATPEVTQETAPAATPEATPESPATNTVESQESHGTDAPQQS